MHQGYVYKWTHTPSFKWYVGFHDGSNKNYVCSSKIVKQLIKDNPTEWERTIIATGDSQEMYELECEILQLMDARNDPRSFNMHNNEGTGFSNLGIPHTEEAKRKIGKANSGPKPERIGTKNPQNSIRMTGVKWSQEKIDKRTATRKANNFSHTEEAKEKIRIVNLGKKISPEVIAKRVATLKANKLKKAMQ